MFTIYFGFLILVCKLGSKSTKNLKNRKNIISIRNSNIINSALIKKKIYIWFESYVVPKCVICVPPHRFSKIFFFWRTCIYRVSDIHLNEKFFKNNFGVHLFGPPKSGKIHCKITIFFVELEMCAMCVQIM